MENLGDNHAVNLKMKPSFNTIYKEYYKKSCDFVRSYVHDDMVAEDLATEALIKLWEFMKDETKDIKVAPLLFTILRNKSLDYLKHLEIVQTTVETIAEWERYDLQIRISTLEVCNPENVFSGEIGNIVSSVLKKMPLQTRRVFILSRIECKSQKEISAIMGISTKAVEYHITKVLKVLRVELKDYLPFLYFVGFFV